MFLKNSLDYAGRPNHCKKLRMRWTKALLNCFAHAATQRYALTWDLRASTRPVPPYPDCDAATEHAHQRMLLWNRRWWDAIDANPDLLEVRTYEVVQRARSVLDDHAARRDARLWVERKRALLAEQLVANAKKARPPERAGL